MKCLVTALASMMIPPLKKPGAGERGMLEKSLRLYRTEQAFARSVPATSIYGNKLISEISMRKPTTLKQLLAMRGMGARRCKSYGADIIKLVSMSDGHSGGDGSAKIKSKKHLKKAPTTRPRPKPRPRPRPRPRPKPALAKTAGSPVPIPQHHKGLTPPQKSSVYAIELEDGRVYVGSSRNVERRIAQHAAGQGSAYTRVYKPTGVRLPRLGNVSGDGDAAERDETLRYMFQRGIPFVRGWKFVQVAMPPDEFDEAEANIRELYNLCRRCGYKGHFFSQCKATFDRWGKQCGGV